MGKVLKKIGIEGLSFHSPLMSEMVGDFRYYASSFDFQQPLTIPLASTVTGKIVLNGESIDLEHIV